MHQQQNKFQSQNPIYVFLDVLLKQQTVKLISKLDVVAAIRREEKEKNRLFHRTVSKV
jgi:hypothetical protein